MAVLVTRPHPDNEATARALRERGFEVVLAPMLRIEQIPLGEELGRDFTGVIATSANALRAVEAELGAFTALPLYAVGDHTAAEARRLGFAKVISAAGDGAKLGRLVRKGAKGRKLLYLAGAELARDLAAELGADGFDVIRRTTYRMVALSRLSRESCAAFAANDVEAVLHYSQRSARAFLEAARRDGVEISALAVPQCCISANVAAILHEAGAVQVLSAPSPDENALFGALERALRP
ncbi:MAG: uroporphyrinogen-III synthase [Bradyrhizobium sp.]|nr:uroporphyrinogen-III synthase [Bradyrhizobium sp.]